MISEKDVEAYRRDGVIVVPEVLDGATLARVRQVIAEVVAGAAEITEHNEVYDLEPGHSRENPRVRRIKTPHKVHPIFNEIVRSKPVMEILTQLLGPGLRLHGSKLNMKSAQYGSPVEWHQDWAFYPHTNDDILAVGIMLDDATSDNGPLMVVPGSHRGPIFDHHADGYFCGAVDPAAVKDEVARAVPMTGRAGSMSFHHVRLLHGSAQNVSSLPRSLLLFEYAAADAWPLLNAPSLEDFDKRLVAGSGTIEPRVTPVPVRLPLPPARNQGSIYENQTAARRFFSFTEEAEAPSRT